MSNKSEVGFEQGQTEDSEMARIQHLDKKVIVDLNFRQLTEKEAEDLLQEVNGVSRAKIVTALGLAGGILIGLISRSLSLLGATVLGGNREASSRHALRREYGLNEPITRVIDSALHGARLQRYVDHYQRRG